MDGQLDRERLITVIKEIGEQNLFRFIHSLSPGIWPVLHLPFSEFQGEMKDGETRRLVAGHQAIPKETLLEMFGVRVDDPKTQRQFDQINEEIQKCLKMQATPLFVFLDDEDRCPRMILVFPARLIEFAPGTHPKA